VSGSLGGCPEPGAGLGAGAHTVPLGDTGWTVWRWGLLRAAGFPADGMERFAAPGAAAAADARLDGHGPAGSGAVAWWASAVAP